MYEVKKLAMTLQDIDLHSPVDASIKAGREKLK
jgi:hypothetical protein